MQGGGPAACALYAGGGCMMTPGQIMLDISHIWEITKVQPPDRTDILQFIKVKVFAFLKYIAYNTKYYNQIKKPAATGFLIMTWEVVRGLYALIVANKRAPVNYLGEIKSAWMKNQ